MATFVLVHGGGHGAWCWERLTPLLTAEGHAVYTPTLTGVGERVTERSPETGLATHIEDVVTLAEQEDLRDIILVGHSYGGTVITGVADRIGARIAELVFLDAPQPGDGESLADAAPELRQALEAKVERVDGVELALFPSPEVMRALGLTDPVDADWALQHLTPHPWKCFIEPLRLTDEAAVLAIPRTSIDCMGPAAGRGRGRNAGRSRGRFHEVETGHDLMITEPRKVADLLLDVARRVEAKPR